jgi:hypothetical protein
MNLAGRPLLLYAQLETHYRFNPGYLGSDHCSPEPGAGSNALALCYRRYASRHSAVYHRCRRVRPWSPSHIVAKQKAGSNPLKPIQQNILNKRPTEGHEYGSDERRTVKVPTAIYREVKR